MKHLLAIILVLTVSVSGFTQGITIKIMDSLSQKGLGYSTVFNKSRQNGGYADSTGTYVLEASIGDSLEIEFVGYANKVIVVKNNAENVFLPRLANFLTPVTVTNLFWLNNKRVEIKDFGRKTEHFNNVIAGVTLMKYFPAIDTSNKWVIGFLSIPVSIGKDYVPRLARIHLYSVTESGDIGDRVPLLNDEIFTLNDFNNNNLVIDLNRFELIMPPRGYFIGIEFIGYVNDNTKNKGMFAIRSSYSSKNSKSFMRFLTKEFVPYQSYMGNTAKPLTLHISAILYKYEK